MENNINFIINLKPWRDLGDNVYHSELFKILSDASLYDTIIKILTPDIRDIICTHTRNLYQYKPDTIKSIIKFGIFDINSDKIYDLFQDCMVENNLDMIKCLYENNFDLDWNFTKLIEDEKYDILTETTFNTILYLEKLGVNLMHNMIIIGIIMIYQNNIIGINYCINNGVDINLLFFKSVDQSNINLIKYFLEIGADIQIINMDVIYRFLCQNNKHIVDILSVLVDYGWDLSSNMNDLAVKSTMYSNLNTLKYLAKMGVDLHYSNNELLMIASIELCENIVIFLLENGADIYAQNNSILNFYLPTTNKKITIHRQTSEKPNYLPMFKLLIKNGAIVNNINETFISYVFTYANEIDDELFLWFLDNGLKIDITELHRLIIEYDTNIIAGLCLKYGINLDINNIELVNLAIRHNDPKLIKILLDMGTQTNIDILQQKICNYVIY